MSMQLSPKDLDLKKRFPGYFNVWVFRGTVIFMVLIFFCVLFLEGFDIGQKPYYRCDNLAGCENPFYYCDHELIGPESLAIYGVYSEVNKPTEEICKLAQEYNIPTSKFVSYGEEFGEKPKYQLLQIALWSMIPLAFVINHILYILRRGNNATKNNTEN